jgi:hypothetical protein
MAETFRLRSLRRSWEASVPGVVLILLLLVTAGGCAQRCAGRGEPEDEFSGKIDPLLTEGEGPGFPSAANLDAWQERRGDIEARFGEILELTVDDEERRRAAIHALLAAESLSASKSQASEVTGSEGGEVRAWARFVLRRSASIGVTAEDRRLIDASIIDGLQEAWETEDHPQRTLPLYQEKAAALRGLARFREPT